jgi:hypothetical protein
MLKYGDNQKKYYIEFERFNLVFPEVMYYKVKQRRKYLWDKTIQENLHEDDARKIVDKLNDLEDEKNP